MDTSLLASWERSLRAEGKAPGTLKAYLADTRALVAHIERDGVRDSDVTEITKAEIETFLVAQRDDGKADATLARRFRSLQQFFGWLEREEEITRSPMAKMRPPRVALQPPPIIPDDEIAKLLDVCSDRKRFEDVRDSAIIRVMLSTGVRAGELVGMQLQDVDLQRATFSVVGKGGSVRHVVLLPKALDTVDRYVRQRRRHPDAKSPAMWIGAKGPITVSGLAQMLERRCNAAEIPPINPHRFRHTWSHTARVLGMSDDDMMATGGWNSPQMLARYGASAKAERSRAAHRRAFEGKEP